ncbi:hypothetical protein LTR16_004811, partial [Cryomyces antarcticus]
MASKTTTSPTGVLAPSDPPVSIVTEESDNTRRALWMWLPTSTHATPTSSIPTATAISGAVRP